MAVAVMIVIAVMVANAYVSPRRETPLCTDRVTCRLGGAHHRRATLRTC
jgi:hypothetical protein